MCIRDSLHDVAVADEPHHMPTVVHDGKTARSLRAEYLHDLTQRLVAVAGVRFLLHDVFDPLFHVNIPSLGPCCNRACRLDGAVYLSRHRSSESTCPRFDLTFSTASTSATPAMAADTP